MSLSYLSLIPHASSSSNNLLWSTRSNAFHKSINKAIGIFSFSIASNTTFLSSRIAVLYFYYLNDNAEKGRIKNTKSGEWTACTSGSQSYVLNSSLDAVVKWDGALPSIKILCNFSGINIEHLFFRNPISFNWMIGVFASHLIRNIKKISSMIS